MREIKFRGKLINSGKWSEGNLIIRKGDNAEIMACTSPDATPIGTYGRIDVDTVGQYTGLHDKNGKEIYEGDIVRFEDIGEDGYEYKEGFDFENEAQVIYEDGQVTLTNFGEGDNSHYANDGQPDILDEILRNGNCEVIGNIYDNPELLEV